MTWFRLPGGKMPPDTAGKDACRYRSVAPEWPHNLSHSVWALTEPNHPNMLFVLCCTVN
jgi:hypothetical protein